MDVSKIELAHSGQCGAGPMERGSGYFLKFANHLRLVLHQLEQEGRLFVGLALALFPVLVGPVFHMKETGKKTAWDRPSDSRSATSSPASISTGRDSTLYNSLF